MSVQGPLITKKGDGRSPISLAGRSGPHTLGPRMMIRLFEQLTAAIRNRLAKRRRGARSDRGLDLGFRIEDGQVTRRHVTLSTLRRATHLAILGKTGTGKSSLVRYLLEQDVRGGRGFLVFDLHGEFIRFLLALVNSLERELHTHFSGKLQIIDPADPISAVGLNPLEQEAPDFVRIAEFAEILKLRWSLDHFGARTDELLRNALYALAAAGLTLLELPLLLSDASFRATCLKQVENREVRQYFDLRYDRVSDAMRATMAEPVLNKITVFTTDPRFRHILGQAKSTCSIGEALDKDYWVIVNLDKGRLGEQAVTFGSLFFTMVKNAIFARQSSTPFSVYCDEIQNFVAFGSSVETILSESRKKSVSLVSASQYLDLFPADMRAALLSTGNQAFFQLSPSDASHIAEALDGGRTLAERLKNLPQRHAIVKSGSDRAVEIRVPEVREPRVDYTDLLNRSRGTWARPRKLIEREITERQDHFGRPVESIIDDWE